MKRAERRRQSKLAKKGLGFKPDEERRVKSTRLATGGTIEKLPDGSFLSHFDNQKYPVHGYPTDEGVFVADVTKKYLISPIRILSKPHRFVKTFLEELNRFGESVGFKYAKNLSPAVRTFYEFAVTLWPKWEGVILAICVILEHDKAYRWRFQDVMMCARKWELVRNPTRETMRLVSIYLEREQRSQYRKLKWVVILLLLLPSVRRAIRQFAEVADFARFNMDKYDLWGAFQSQIVGLGNPHSYNFGGLSLDKMKEVYEKL